MSSIPVATNLSSTPAHWMPFTANRQFHKDPRVVVAAEQNTTSAKMVVGYLTRCRGFGVAAMATTDQKSAQPSTRS